MKTKVVLMLSVLTLISFATISCDKNDDITKPEESTEEKSTGENSSTEEESTGEDNGTGEESTGENSGTEEESTGEDNGTREESTGEEACVGGNPGADALPTPMILKFDGKYEYSQYVTITYDFIENCVKAYPSAVVTPLNLKELTNGYYYAPCDYFSEQVYTNITFDEYRALGEKGELSKDLLKSRIISTDFLSEEYSIRDISSFMNDNEIDFDKLNLLCETGEFAENKALTKIK